MYTTLLFKESPFIGLFFILLTIYLLIIKNKYIIIPFLILIALMIFYRYKKYTIEYNDNIIVSPAEGKITNIMELSNNRILVSIFLSVFELNGNFIPFNFISPSNW